jgi:hypothetical protein
MMLAGPLAAGDCVPPIGWLVRVVRVGREAFLLLDLNNGISPMNIDKPKTSKRTIGTITTNTSHAFNPVFAWEASIFKCTTWAG